MFKLAWVLPLFLVSLLSACAPNYSYKPPTDVDVFERAPVGLPFDVSDFTWRYLAGGRIEVMGTIQNNSTQAYNRVVLYTMLFDEQGKAVAMGEAHVRPTPIAANSVGTFKLVVRTDRPQGIQHLRLLTNAQSE